MYERTVGYLKAERLHTKVNSKEISTWKVHNPRGHYLRVVSVEKGTRCWFVERFAFVMNEGGGMRRRRQDEHNNFHWSKALLPGLFITLIKTPLGACFGDNCERDL